VLSKLFARSSPLSLPFFFPLSLCRKKSFSFSFPWQKHALGRASLDPEVFLYNTSLRSSVFLRDQPIETPCCEHFPPLIRSARFSAEGTPWFDFFLFPVVRALFLFGSRWRPSINAAPDEPMFAPIVCPRAGAYSVLIAVFTNSTDLSLF